MASNDETTTDDGGRLASIMKQASPLRGSNGADVIDVDLSDVDFDGMNAELIPNDTWVYAKSIKVEKGLTKSKIENGQEVGAKNKLDVEYVVQGGKYKGRHIWKTYYLYGTAAEMYLSFTAAVGQYDETSRKPTATPTSLMNQFLWLRIIIELGNPKNPALPDGEKWADKNLVAPWKSHQPATARLRDDAAYGVVAPTMASQDLTPGDPAKPSKPAASGKGKWDDADDDE